MSKERVKQLTKEIDKLDQEIHIVEINFKVVAAQMIDGAAIFPLANELERIRKRMSTDIRDLLKEEGDIDNV